MEIHCTGCDKNKPKEEFIVNKKKRKLCRPCFQRKKRATKKRKKWEHIRQVSPETAFMRELFHYYCYVCMEKNYDNCELFYVILLLELVEKYKLEVELKKGWIVNGMSYSKIWWLTLNNENYDIVGFLQNKKRVPKVLEEEQDQHNIEKFLSDTNNIPVCLEKEPIKFVSNIVDTEYGDHPEIKMKFVTNIFDTNDFDPSDMKQRAKYWSRVNNRLTCWKTIVFRMFKNNMNEIIDDANKKLYARMDESNENNKRNEINESNERKK
jgi:hypothetical protein